LWGVISSQTWKQQARFCQVCDESYELKSQRKSFGRKITDGALGAMNARLAANDNPNLLLLNYDASHATVTNLIVVPKHFFVREIIEPRKPLAPTARRAGWQGCNILIGRIPDSGKIWIVRDSTPSDKQDVLEAWQSTLFLRDRSLAARGWLIEVMKCVEQIGREEFTLTDVYAFEGVLSRLYPDNANVRPKIRQQLQVLRDQGFLQFLGGGTYRLGRNH
jgi:type II restriction enzyme